jgi:dimeric dUTPase (all-alpha-NTP-PPase superfamily)
MEERKTLKDKIRYIFQYLKQGLIDQDYARDRLLLLIKEEGVIEQRYDRLQDMFDLQKKLQKRLRNDDLPTFLPDRIPITVTSIIAELGEILEEDQRWKDWRKNPNLPDYGNLYMEIVDLWHFVINLTLYFGMDADTLFKVFLKKNEVNHERQDNEY